MSDTVLVLSESDPARSEAAELISALDRDLGARYPGAIIPRIDIT
jgi:hypothetical protein